MSDPRLDLGKTLTCDLAEKVQPRALTDEFVPFVGCRLSWIRVQIERARKKLKQYQGQSGPGFHMLPGTSYLPGSSNAKAMAVQWRRFLDEMLLLQSRNQYRIEKLQVRLRLRPNLLASGGVYLIRGQAATFVKENRLWYYVDSTVGSGYLSKGDVHLSAPIDLSDVDHGIPIRIPGPQRDSIESAGRDTVMR